MRALPLHQVAQGHILEPSETKETVLYKDALEQYQMNMYASLGFTNELQQQLDAYNVKHGFVNPLAPRIAKQAHQQACVKCKTFNGFEIGCLFFGGKKCDEEGFVKYCLECVRSVV